MQHLLPHRIIHPPRTRIRIPHARPARPIRHRRMHLLNHRPHDRLERTQLLSHPHRAIPAPLVPPARPAECAGRTAGAARRGSDGGRAQAGEHEGGGPGGDFGGCGHPAREVRFEGLLVDVAVEDAFAGGFPHYVGGGAEEVGCCVEEGLGAIGPDGVLCLVGR